MFTPTINVSKQECRLAYSAHRIKEADVCISTNVPPILATEQHNNNNNTAAS